MLMPKRTKYRKQQRGRMKGKETRGIRIEFGDYGLMALEPAWITSRQIEAARRAITHALKRGGQIYIRIFPDKPVTSKPAETRMGSGKGSPEYWVAVVKTGRILFEVGGVDIAAAKEAMLRASAKLPIRTKMIIKENITGNFKTTAKEPVTATPILSISDKQALLIKEENNE